MKSNRSTVTRLFLCAVLLLVMISCCPASSVSAVTPANSTFGFYSGSPITSTKSTPATNASYPRTVTPANSTFGFYFGSPILLHPTLSNVTHVANIASHIGKTSNIASHIGKTSTKNVTQESIVKSIRSMIPSIYQVRKAVAPKTNSTIQITTDRAGVPVVGYGYQNGIYIGNQRNPLTTAHFALGYYDRYNRNGSAVYKQLFLNNSNWLVNHAVNHGNYSIFEYNFPWPEYNLLPHWHSALTQAEGIKALIDANKLTGDKKYLDTAKQLLNSFYINVNNGGVTNKMGPSGWMLYHGTLYAIQPGWWFESFASPGGKQPRFLTDMINTVLGIHYYYNHTGSKEAKYLFDQGVLALNTSLPNYNVAGHNYSYSDIFRHINTPDNHELNVALLNQLYDITKDQTFKRYHDLWYNSHQPKAR